MPRVIPEGQSRFINNESNFSGALPIIEPRLSESRNPICAVLLVDDVKQNVCRYSKCLVINLLICAKTWDVFSIEMDFWMDYRESARVDTLSDIQHWRNRDKNSMTHF
jgi:hypothetical protein